MSEIDTIFLAIGVTTIGIFLIFSKAMRAIVFESLRHPYVASTIEIHNGDVKVVRPPQKSNPAPPNAVPALSGAHRL